MFVYLNIQLLGNWTHVFVTGNALCSVLKVLSANQ